MLNKAFSALLEKHDNKFGKDDLVRIFEDEKLRDFVEDVLGVCGGAFGLAHSSKEKFMLLETSKARNELHGDLPIIDIPYFHDKGKGFGNLADLLFIARRSDSKLERKPS